jgi:prepilin-type N-terminal cleavage/methylation domain-containing protein
MRKGFSLLEVLLATAILLGCAVVLLELAAIGREHVNSAEELAMAHRICETRINEILAGAEPAKAVENEEMVEQPGWKLSVEVNPVDRQPGLAALRVTVFREADEKHRGKQYTLVRWIRDPDRDGASSSPSDSPFSAPPSLFGSEPSPAEGAEP